EMATGTTIVADAVLLVASEISVATSVVATNSQKLLSSSGKSEASPAPIASASLVWFESTPSAKPPPYSSTMPQSISAASRQVMALPSRSPGSRNSSAAPSSAATASGRLPLTALYQSLCTPAVSAITPGTIHNVIVTKNAASVERCPTVQGPSWRRWRWSIS